AKQTRGHTWSSPEPPSPVQIHTWVSEGPSEAQAVCVNCQNNSVGDRCDTCRPGFFLLDGTCTR
ncbi:MEGF8 protein, partial [Notiomystis cincta]|nr:MEGF8 protein [Notiomystis cincta]